MGDSVKDAPISRPHCSQAVSAAVCLSVLAIPCPTTLAADPSNQAGSHPEAAFVECSDYAATYEESMKPDGARFRICTCYRAGPRGGKDIASAWTCESALVAGAAEIERRKQLSGTTRREVPPRPGEERMGLYCARRNAGIICTVLPLPLPAEMRHLLPEGQPVGEPILLSSKAVTKATLLPTEIKSEAPAPGPRPVSYLEGPSQKPVARATRRLMQSGVSEFALTGVASYDIRAVVMSKGNPGADRLHPISSVDMGLAWASLPFFRNCISYRHEGRRLYTDYSTACSLSQSDLHDFSNNHLIPNSARVQRQIEALRVGQGGRLEGYLVDVAEHSIADGGRSLWRTSRTRDDEGDGACEIMLVTRVTAGPMIE
jgi:hypothetical protein